MASPGCLFEESTSRYDEGSGAVAVVCVGGPTKGTRFRPLSMRIPKPLFPLAGRPMVQHAIHACARISDLRAIFLVGFYNEEEFAMYVAGLSGEINVPVRYLQEERSLGSGGCLYHFRDEIEEEKPSSIIVINCDVCCTFPLEELMNSHARLGGIGTMMVKRVCEGGPQATEFGNAIGDPVTHELLHYTEKPEQFVGELINAGVYIFSLKILDLIERIIDSKKVTSTGRPSSPVNYVRLDNDVFVPLAGRSAPQNQRLYVYETSGFWENVKAPGYALKCSAMYLDQYKVSAPNMLTTSGQGVGQPTIIGNVHIHPSAKVHETAVIGPNVSIGPHVRIGSGVRVKESIILDSVNIAENACIVCSILGWKSIIGKWVRVEGSGKYEERFGVTILGEAVIVEDEVLVVNCIVLPNKVLAGSVRNDVIL